MENNSQTKLQNKIHPWILRGFCFILFLSVIILPPTFEPSDWSRAILFRMILTGILFFLFFKFFYKKELSFSLPKIKNPVYPVRDLPLQSSIFFRYKNFLSQISNGVYIPFFILLAFIASLILATVFSEDIMFSFFGSPGRAGGVLNYIFLVVFAVLLAVFTKEKDWKTMFKFLLGTGIIISLLAFIQYFAILKNVFLSSESGRVNSFLGNASFLAVYMLFLSFLSFVFFLQEKIKKIKIVYLCLFLIFIFTIIITGSRATYLGVLIGFVYFFFFYPVKLTEGRASPVKLLKIIATAILVLAIIVVFLFNFFPQISEKNNLLKLVANRLSIERVVKDMTGARIVAWQMTLKAIKEKPLLGWGPENFYIGFEKYFDPVPFNRQRPYWDRAHNIFLETAVNSGIVSAILYLAFWLAIFWQLGKFKKNQGNGKYAYLSHGIQAMFIGYLTVLLFNFDSFSTYLISFFFIGYSFYLISNQNQDQKQTILPKKNNILQKKPVIVILAIFIIIFFWFYNIKPMYVASQVDYAKNLTAAKKCGKSLSIMENVREKSNMLKSYAGLRYSDFLKKCASINPEKEVEYVKKGMEALKISSAFQPKFTRTWLFMGSFANVLAAREQNTENRNKILAEARGYLEKAKNLSPNRQEIFIEIVKNYMVLENHQLMKKTAEDCAKIDPSQGECYWYMGIAEIFMGDQENGKKHIEESKEKSGFAPVYIQLGAAYMSQKNYEGAAEAYRILTLEQPKNASFHAIYALLSRELGNYDIAANEAVKVFELQPNNNETEKFIIELLMLTPNDPSLYASLTFIYKKLGEEEKARQQLLKMESIYYDLFAKNPQSYGYLLNLTRVYKELGKYEKAYQGAVLLKKLAQETNPAGYDQYINEMLQSMPPEYWNKYLIFLEEFRLLNKNKK